MHPINGKWNIKENEKPIPYGLRLDSIQWQKEHKEEGETNSLRIKTYFQSIAKVTQRRMRNKFPINYVFIPFIGKMNLKKKEKLVP